MKVRVISLTSQTYPSPIALAQTHEDAFFAKYKQLWKRCLVTSTWSRRTTVSQEYHCKHSLGSLLPKETKAAVQPLKDEDMQTTRRSHGNSHKMKAPSRFQKWYSCSFNNKLSGTLNAMTGNIASFYTSKFHTPLNFTISWICVFSTFLFSMILINVSTFSLEIIQILAI